MTLDIFLHCQFNHTGVGRHAENIYKALRESVLPPRAMHHVDYSDPNAARALGFRVARTEQPLTSLGAVKLPCLVLLTRREAIESNSNAEGDGGSETSEKSSLQHCQPAIVAHAEAGAVVLFESGSNTPKSFSAEEVSKRYKGTAFQLALQAEAIKDPDAPFKGKAAFGFRWFIPELLKHRRVWRDVLVASLIIQLLALGAPLFTPVVIDKVVVHRTMSTLIVVGIGSAVFMLFSAILTWVRQYLVLHTGNRVDAVLGAAVFDHLFKLPLRYFEHRPTGVIAARLRAVENIREFVASAAITLILDLPFLFVFVGVMFYYSVTLTLLSLAVIGAIVVLSIAIAPVFRTRLNEQFLLGARNQAFTTEYIAGLETVKSIQMESQLKSRYGDYLAEYLRSGFSVRQISNTYSVFANGLEQLLSLLILVGGAYTVMNNAEFTIGMLVAFQMFASRVSQPMLRLVGLWQQFQQANLSVQRLGDIMNAPVEPYSLATSRVREGRGRIEVENLSFKYSDDLPFLYQGLSLTIEPGRVIAIMGPSGSGKSTFAKLLQGFYQPSGGTIRIDGSDIRYMSANELRNYFGVVPQETVLFSGTLYDNLLAGNPLATFEDVVSACRFAEIHDVIEILPLGYKSEVGERGVGLSGGQRQRVAIARALLKRPKILVFDEATSSLDSETAEQIAKTINQLKSKATVVLIAHAIPKGLHVDDLIRLESTLQSSVLVGVGARMGGDVTGWVR